MQTVYLCLALTYLSVKSVALFNVAFKKLRSKTVSKLALTPTLPRLKGWTATHPLVLEIVTFLD